MTETTQHPGGQAAGLLAQRLAVFPPDPGSPGQARALLKDALTAAGRLRWVDDAALAISEVVTNAALHAHTQIEVSIEVWRDRLEVKVVDRNPVQPLQRQYDEQATTGRGMALLAAVTQRCGVSSRGADGKVVWFTVSDRPQADHAELLVSGWAEDGEPAATDGASIPSRTVILPAMPATLWLSARQHHDAMLRELVLYLAEHDDEQVDLALADTARGWVTAQLVHAVEAAQRDGTAQPAVPDGHPAPLPPVPPTLTLTLSLPTSIGPAYAALQDALDVAERLAVAGRLLARPGLPEIVAVRDWVCEQVVAQLAGVGPSAWPGAAQRHFELAVNDTGVALDWDDSVVRDSDRGVVAADDANRIVAISRPLATLLGWLPEELVGRRVVTLIPPHLREAHVAGFSRHMTTGEAHVLGVPLVLPVLRADGRELQCDFLVERAPDSTGRSVYLAWISPMER